MNTQDRIAVTSRSFSKHPLLKAELNSKYKNVTYNEAGKSFEGGELVEFLRGHNKAIIAVEKIDEEVLRSLPELRVLSKVGVGIDNICQDALKNCGVQLAWTAGTNSRPVSELALALMLNVLRHVNHMHSELLLGKFAQKKGSCLSGKHVGLLGCGYVGRDLVRLLQPFECTISAFEKHADKAFFNKYGVQELPFAELMASADIISMHLPLTAETRGLINEKNLDLCKPGAVLINTARGGLIEEQVLAKKLQSGALGGAGLDVFAVEPPGDLMLLSLPNVVATPHIGGSTEEAILAMGRAAIAGLSEMQ